MVFLKVERENDTGSSVRSRLHRTLCVRRSIMEMDSTANLFAVMMAQSCYDPEAAIGL